MAEVFIKKMKRSEICAEDLKEKGLKDVQDVLRDMAPVVAVIAYELYKLSPF